MNEQGELQLDVSQKRIWYARDQLMSTLAALGLPAGVMDGSHALVRGSRQLATWLVSMHDATITQLFGSNSSEYERAMSIFSAACPFKPESVKTIAPTGFSVSDGRVSIDGCALKVTTENGDAYVIPVARNALTDGSEYTEIVSMVPMAAMAQWAEASKAAALAARSLNASRLVMRVFNGPDVKVGRITSDDLVLDETVRAAFMDDLIGFLGRRSWYEERNISWKQSYLLAGPPGTGKTSLARWAASELDMPCMGFDFTDPYADGRTFSQCLALASSMAPCILVLDDLDKVLGGQNRSGITPHAIQTALSGMGDLDGVIIIGTCNSTSLIRGVLPDGSENPLARRFDRIIEVGLPDGTLRSKYAAKLLSKDGFDERSTGAFFGGNSTDGWSYDDIRAAVTAAANKTSRRGGLAITSEDVAYGVTTISSRRGTRTLSATSKGSPDGTEGD